MRKNKCEYKKCKKMFDVDYKHRNQRFCCKQCMYDWRKEENWTTSICLGCGEEYKHRKNERHPRSGKKRMFCSDICMKTSDWKKEKTREQLLNENPMDNPESRKKISNTLSGRNVGFGSDGHKVNHTKTTKIKMSISTKESYRNNKDEILAKRNETYIKKYGMTNKEWLKKQEEDYCKSMGIANVYQLPKFRKAAINRISKGQRFLYEETRKEYKDAILEHWLEDVQKSVDIFIPSQNKIIEYYGDYWHCNPNKYKVTYYNVRMKKTASEIWERDKKREQELIDAGYQVTIIWENH